ncbi:MAG: TIR domain-containing protein [Candidatus Eisenbacteria bacterium]|nr:TIR domain-containing protein [Candidatus Eisenbacteria bacterium]
MAKRVFFSFDYQDVADFRANVVRQSWRAKPDREAAGFFDASIWESARKQGTTALKRLINGAIDGTSVTCVLVGSDTYLRPWVRYELLLSFYLGKGLLAVHVNSIRDKNREVKPLGPNPLEYVGVTYSDTGLTATLWEKKADKWIEYGEIGNGPSFQTGGVAQKYWGKGFNLSNFFPVYDWIAHDGYINFASWVD